MNLAASQQAFKKYFGVSSEGHVFLRSKFIGSLDEVIFATCDVEIFDLFAAWVVKLLTSIHEEL